MKIRKTEISYLIETPKIIDEGSLIFTEGRKHLPFSIKRVYLISNVKKGTSRGYHAHKKCQQVLFCIKGTVKILLDNGRQTEEIILNKPNVGIFLDKLMWHTMEDFSVNTTLLVFASDYYQEKDYIRSYDGFLNYISTEIKFKNPPLGDFIIPEGSIL